MSLSPAAIASLLAPTYWIIISSILLTAGDITFRSWLEQQWQHGFAVACGVYMVGSLCLMMSFFGQNIAIATIVGITMNIVLYLVYAHFVYGDMLSYKELFGISLGLAAIYILEFS